MPESVADGKPARTIKRTPGTGGVVDLWKDIDGKPTRLATGRWADGLGKPQGVGKRWRGWYVGDDGKQRTKRFRTETEAESWSNAEKGKVVTHQWVSPDVGTETFRDVAEEWFPLKFHRMPKTIAGYRSVLDVLILPKWGDTPMKEIAFPELLAWMSGLAVNGSQAGTGLSASRIRQTRQCMNAIYEYAVKSGRATKNVVADISGRTDLPVERPKPKEYLTHTQLLGLADRAGQYRVLTLVLGYCGIRPSEAFALRRKNVKARKLHIRESSTAVAGRGMVTSEFTKNGEVRDVAVPPPVWAQLVKELPDDPEALVFPGRGGGMTLGQYRWPFDKALKAMQELAKEQRAKERADGTLDEHGEPVTPEFPSITPYSLRHTAASLLIQTNANIKVVQRQLGHKTASMTLDTYGHLYNDDLDAAAKALGDAMTAAGG